LAQLGEITQTGAVNLPPFPKIFRDIVAGNLHIFKTKSKVASRGIGMCLAVPGKVLSVENTDPAFRSGYVDFCGVRKTVNLAFTPEVVGDYVLVHVGFALTRVDEEEAQRTFSYLSQIGALKDEGLEP